MSRQASRTGSIRLKAKSTVPVHYTFTPGSGASEDGRQLLIVCLSGLCDPMKVWNGTLKHLAQFRQSRNCPPILTYDRFGCGKTGHDPSDAGKGPTEWHDLGDAAKELHELLLRVYETELGISFREKVWPIFVAHSIGTAVAQLYAAKFPGEVVGYLLLDATLTDSDGTSLMPDPDAPGFDATALPGGITPAMLRDSRMKQHSSPFNRNMPNTERLRWNNIQEYIPVIGAPKFTGPAKGTPLITLMMHDDQAYAKQLKQTVKVPEVVSMAYVVPAWRIFLSKLSSIGAPHLTKGPLVTKGSGHFIRQEKPDMVALELSDLLDKLYYLLDQPASKL